MSSAFRRMSAIGQAAVFVRRLADRQRANSRDPAARAAALARAERIARLLDSAIAIPGTGRRIGIDALLGLVPVAGDLAGTLLGGWIVYEAFRLGAPAGLIARMLANLAVDTGIGAIPIAGDLFDAAWKANARNADLLREWLTARR